MFSGRRDAERETTSAMIRETGAECLFVRSDVSSEPEVKALIEKTVATYGRLDFAFNNAGFGTVPKPLHEQSVEDFIRERMKRFTLFTFLYLALGVCLTAIALGYPNLPSSLQTSLFVSAGASYIVCLLSTFPFWRETTIRFYRRRNSAVIIPWLVIGFNIVWMIWEVQSQNWTMEAILQAFLRVIVVLLFAEIIVITWQVNSKH
ncbi:SDR family oxidoreductase [Nostoc sp. DedQUE09]|uniref:SDR family oxidoreductase n=1 Tax=Nostoc sp. DedQUE09 TaxID=3075394 RepID=UPI003A0FBD74